MSAPWGISADQGAYWAWVHTARRPGELDTERSDTKATRATFPQVRRSRANPAEPWIRPHRAQARRPPPRRHHRPGGTTDDQSAMRSRTLAEAQASYPRTVIPGRPPNACKPCRTYRHHECLGSDRCTCAWCHGRAMIARGWETFDGSNNVQTLRAALGRALVIASQKQARREVVWWSNPEPAPDPCACGCGQVVIASKTGRPRLYVSRHHRKKAYRRRVRARGGVPS